MHRVILAGLVAIAMAVALPGVADGHPERPSEYPSGAGTFPQVRHTGPSRVVCKPDSGRRIRSLRGEVRARNLALLARCRYRHIQQAVDAAGSGERILILPGVYREEPSRRVPNPDPSCRDLYVRADGRDRLTPSYEYEVRCPNSRNLVAVIGDSLDDPDRRCDQKCDLQIQGTGARPRDVLVVGDKRKQNVFKADRADGIVFYNLAAQFSDYNNFYVHETQGFRYDRILSRWSNEYGFLSFVSDHGVYEDLEAHGAGDAGIYPGSGPETGGRRCGIVIRRVNAHHNLQGNSGSAGNGLCYERNRFHHNGVGVVVDSFSPGHPGSPQDSSRWRGNLFYSNNLNLFTAARDRYCKRPYLDRDPRIVCPAIMVPIGTGLLIAGGNENLVERNWFWDHRRYGAMLFHVPAAIRGEPDPAKQDDTSHGNRFVRNVMGVRPGRSGRPDPNGVDFWWDEQGERNCWQDNRGPGGRVVGDPSPLPACPGSATRAPGDADKFGSLVACAAWDSETNTDPAGCDWFALPRERRRAAIRSPHGHRLQPVRIAAAAGAGTGPLTWRAQPRVLGGPRPLPYVLRGEVVNRSDRPVTVRAEEVRLEGGVEGQVRFLAEFVRSVEPANRGRVTLPDGEVRRLGRLVTIAPGRSAPVSVGWRGWGRLARLDLRVGTLDVPDLGR